MGGNKLPSEKNNWGKIERNDVTIALYVLYAKKKYIYILVMFQDITQIVKNKLFFQRFQTEKNAKLSLKDAKLSPKEAKLSPRDDNDNSIILH